MTTDRPSGVSGWLLILVLLLVVWGPVQFGLLASSAIPALSVRGPSLAAVLVLRMLAVAFGLAAGLALAGQSAAAVRLAKTSIVFSAATDLFVYATPFMPNNRMPGDTPIYAAAALAYWAGWFAYLTRSRRVRNTYA